MHGLMPIQSSDDGQAVRTLANGFAAQATPFRHCVMGFPGTDAGKQCTQRSLGGLLRMQKMICCYGQTRTTVRRVYSR